MTFEQRARRALVGFEDRPLVAKELAAAINADGLKPVSPKVAVQKARQLGLLKRVDRNGVDGNVWKVV